MTHHDIADELNQLIETCKDGEYGFKTCADHVQSDFLKTLLSERASGCAQAALELRALVLQYGGKPADSGSMGGAMHRGWIAARSTLSSPDDLAMLEECERGEDKALAHYRKALKQPLPADVLLTVERQAHGTQLNHDAVRDARDRLRAVKSAS